MALTEIPIELSSTPSIVDGGNATAITISSAELVTVANGLTLTDGNVVVAAGHGIDFSAQTATSASGASTTAELLNSYEEGTWTPAISGGTQAITAVQQARYTRIGRSVLLNVYITQSTVTNSTALVLAGLPFTASSYNATGILNFATNSSGGPIICRTVPSSTALHFYRCDVTQVAVTQTQNAGHCIFSITYLTDA
jgi:hypothetical protein